MKNISNVRINKGIWVLYGKFILNMLNNIKKYSDEYDVPKIYAAVYNSCENPDYCGYLQFVDGVPKGLVIGVIREDLLGGRFGLVWLASVLANGDSLMLKGNIDYWFKYNRCTYVIAQVEDFRPARVRVMKRLGFKKLYETYAYQLK